MLKINSVDLQGSIFTLLVVHIRTTSIQEIRISLMKKINQSPHFFSQKIPVVINASKINNQINWKNLYQMISEIGLFVIGVCCCYDKMLKNTIIQSGLPILTPGQNINNFNNFTDPKKHIYNNRISKISKTQIIQTQIRSGQRIYAKNKDLIIIANVSNGSEIISDGNIYIYGTMRGRVLAGASGNKESQIFCTNLFSTLVSIGGYYRTIDQIPQEFLGKSVRIYLKNNNLMMQRIL